MNEKLLKALSKLKEKGVKYRLLEFAGIARTSEDVARLYDVDPREIIKTLIVKADDSYFAVMLPGVYRIDNKKLLKELNARKCRFLNEHELKEQLFFEPGEVCPILIEKLPILVDRTVFETKKINFGSGDLYYGIEISTEDLKKVVKIDKIVDVAANI
ncbi:MAG: YbaK/EbsC family protein [Candidatus Aenigmarchaeota archaeon]|nr:YbaK/EbsC family protein [Candidatus Aenigmarchaeota archaeon]